ncbi:MAG: hypothetical protein ABJA90_07890 [Ginsengibacter sp.]
MGQIRYFAGSFLWSVISKLTDAAVKFFTIPLMLHYFGKDNYGILTLAVATNAYMNLLNLGINTGAVKYFSQWIAEKKYALIHSVSSTSVSFYLIIGVVNSIALIVIALFGQHLFHISPQQFSLLKTMFFIMAFYAIINWSTSVFNQLLIANERITFIQQINIIKSIANLLLIYLTTRFSLSLLNYFILFSTLNSVFVIPYYLKARNSNLIRTFLPGKDWKNFKLIYRYSLSIFAMGIFSFTATQSRPIVLSMFNNSGAGILAEYRVIEVFPIFIISIGAMIITILLPITTKLVQQKQHEKIAEMAYKGTGITSILVCVLCFPIMINSRDILTLYVGEKYGFLAPWLSLWVFTIILFLHNSPVASLVLSTGKTKMLVYSSAIACVTSIIINAFMAKAYGVGSAVLGYLIYIVIQMSFYYLYFNTKILNLESIKVFKAFAIPTLIAFIACLPLYIFKFDSLPVLLIVLIKAVIWILLFFAMIFIFKIIDLQKVVEYIKKRQLKTQLN